MVCLSSTATTKPTPSLERRCKFENLKIHLCGFRINKQLTNKIYFTIMKKLFLKSLALVAMLLCGLTASATQYCAEEVTPTAGETNKQTLVFTASKTGDMETTFTLTSTTSTLTGLFEAVFQIDGGGVVSSTDGNYWKDWTLSDNTLTKVVTWSTYPSKAIQLHLVARRDQTNGGSDIIGYTFTDIDVSQTCIQDDKKVSDLTLTAPITANHTLAIDETYNVAYSSTSTGAVTYSSSNVAVATISDKGQITALSAGTTTITVAQEADETYRAGKKSFTLTVTSTAPIACDKGFGTYKGVVDLYDWSGQFAGTSSCGKVQLCIVTIGDALMYKASVVDGTFESGINYFCQLRPWQEDLTGMKELWALDMTADKVTRTYDLTEGAITGYGSTIPMTSYMVISGCGARTMQTLNYKRDYINNPSGDITAPTLDAPTITTNERNVVITFPQSSEDVFYILKDETQNVVLGTIASSITLVSGETAKSYKFACYAVDFDGNMSEPQALDVTVPAYSYYPETSAPTPSHTASNVISFYSDTYTPAINLWGKRQWNVSGTYKENTNGTDNYLWYGDTEWWGWEFGVNDGFNKADVSTGVDCSSMGYMHIDVWAKDNGTIRVIPIWGGTNLAGEGALPTNDQYGAEVEIKANQWNAVDIPIATGFAPADKVHDFSSIFQFKFGNLTTSFVAIDNVYFWKNSGGATAVDVQEVAPKVSKTIENGQIVIIRDGVKYNVVGAVIEK